MGGLPSPNIRSLDCGTISGTGSGTCILSNQGLETGTIWVKRVLSQNEDHEIQSFLVLFFLLVGLGVQSLIAVGLVLLGSRQQPWQICLCKYLLYNLTTLDMVGFERKFSQNRLNRVGIGNWIYNQTLREQNGNRWSSLFGFVDLTSKQP